ncbi:MAG: hypothetical protein AAGD11_10235 [Planctomycetota bacterium]
MKPFATLITLSIVASSAHAQNTCQEFVFQNFSQTVGCAEGFGTFEFTDAADETFIDFNGAVGEIDATFDSAVDIAGGLPSGIVEPFASSVELIKLGSSAKARAVMHRHTSRLELSPDGTNGLTNADAFTGSIGDLVFTPVLPDGVTNSVSFDIDFTQTFRTDSPPADVDFGLSRTFGFYAIGDLNNPGVPVTLFNSLTNNVSGSGLDFSPDLQNDATISTVDLGNGSFEVSIRHQRTVQLTSGNPYLFDTAHSVAIDVDGISGGPLPTWLADSETTTRVSLTPQDSRVTMFLGGVEDPAPPADQIIAFVDDGKLYRIDTATRQATLIGPGIGQSLTPTIKALAFGNDGTLLAISREDNNQNSQDAKLLEIDLQTGEETSLGFIDRPIGNATGLAVDPATDTLIINVDRGPNSSAQDRLAKIFRTGAGQTANGGQVTEVIGDLNVDGNSVVGLEFDGDGVLFGIDGFNDLQSGVKQEELVQIDHLDPSNVNVIGDSELEAFPNIGDFTIGPSGRFWAINEDDQGFPELVEIDPGSGLGTSLGRITGTNNFSSDAFAALPIDALLTGDFTEDEFGDGQDYLAWQRSLGTGTEHSNGDGNLDGVVDRRDLDVWRLSHGLTFSAVPTLAIQSAAAAQVPESSSCVVAFAGMLIAISSVGRNSSLLVEL